jgi:predicted amino acid-binding ACT domain protein
MDMTKITTMLFPVMISAIAWLLGQMSSMQGDLIDIKSKMPALITTQGVPTDSPLSAEARNKLKEDINNKIGELNVRIRILEEHDKDRK